MHRIHTERAMWATPITRSACSGQQSLSERGPAQAAPHSVDQGKRARDHPRAGNVGNPHHPPMDEARSLGKPMRRPKVPSEKCTSRSPQQNVVQTMGTVGRASIRYGPTGAILCAALLRGMGKRWAPETLCPTGGWGPARVRLVGPSSMPGTCSSVTVLPPPTGGGKWSGRGTGTTVLT